MSVDLGTAYAKMELDHTGFTSGIKDVKRDIASATTQFETASKGMTAIGNSMAEVGGTLTKSVSVPLLGVAAAGMKVATDFEKSMSGVRAITGATGSDFDALRNEAIKLGADTAFSSGEVADAMTEMAKAGWGTQQILDGMNGVLAASAASGEQLGTVSTIVADAISGFGLAASDSTRVADLLAQSANAGTIGITDLGESFKYIAPVASSMNMSIEDVTQAITAMSKAGIKGSQAGTSLRDILLNLVNPGDDAAMAMQQLHISASNADGTFKSLDEIVANLQSSMSGLTDTEKAHYATLLAGKEASSGLLSILNMTPAEYDAIGESMDNAKGVAEETAKVMQDNLRSQIEQLGGSLESLAIKLSDIVLPTLTEYAKRATEFVNSIVDMDAASQKRILEIAAALIALGPALFVVGKTLSALGTMVGVFGKLKEGMGIIQAFITVTKGAEAGSLAASFTAMAEPVAIVIAAIAALTAGLVYLYKTNEQFRNSVNGLAGTIRDDLLGLMDKLQAGMAKVQEVFAPVIEKIKESFSSIDIGPQLEAIVSAVSNMYEAIRPILDILVEVVGVLLVGAFAAVVSAVSGFVAALEPLSQVVMDVFNILSDLVNVIISLGTALTTGDFSGVTATLSKLMSDLNQLVVDGANTIIAFVEGFFTTAIELIDGFTGGAVSKVVDFFANLRDNIVIFFTTTIPGALDTFANETIPNFVALVTEWFEQLPYNIGFATGEIIVYIVGLGEQLIEWVGTAFVQFINSVITFFQQLPASASANADKVFGFFRDLGVKLIEWVVTVVPEFINMFVNFMSTLPGKIWEWIKQIPDKISSVGASMNQSGKDIMNALWDGLKSVWDGISGWFEGIVSQVENWVRGIKDGIASASAASGSTNGSHANGLSYVPFNGYVAQLHEGERVLTRNEASEYNNGGSGSYVFNFYSPEAIDPYTANKLFQQTLRDLDEGMI